MLSVVCCGSCVLCGWGRVGFGCCRTSLQFVFGTGLLHFGDGDHGGRGRKMAGSEIGDIAYGGKKI